MEKEIPSVLVLPFWGFTVTCFNFSPYFHPGHFTGLIRKLTSSPRLGLWWLLQGFLGKWPAPLLRVSSYLFLFLAFFLSLSFFLLSVRTKNFFAPPPRRLPYSTDSYFHILIFVFVSWVGGGDPPWVPAKSLSLHGGQKIQARTAFFSKLVLCVYLKGVNAKKWQKKVKNTSKKGMVPLLYLV